MASRNTLPRCDELSLHLRLVSGEPDAAAEIAENLLPALRRSVGAKFRQVDYMSIDTAAVDAIMNYLIEPNRFTPGRASLAAFLHVCAARRVIDMIRAAKRRGRHEVSMGLVVDSVGEGDLQATSTADRDEACQVEVLRIARTPAEKSFLVAKMSGERSSSVLAQFIEEARAATQAEQRKIVHRTWARMRARIRALGLTHDKV